MRLDPKHQYCQCGHTFKLSWYHYTLMLFKVISYRCPRCQSHMKFKLTYFVNQEFDNETKRDNKQILNEKRRSRP